MTAPGRRLLVAWAATIALAVVLAALLLRRGSDLEPRRSSVIELDDPGPATTVRPPG
jgi:hypothetical protein